MTGTGIAGGRAGRASVVAAVCAAVVTATMLLLPGATPARASAPPTSAPAGGTAAPVPPVRHAPPSCFGAASLAAPAGFCHPVTSGHTMPSPAAAANDKSAAYRPHGSQPDCFAHPPSFVDNVCSFDATTSSVRIALVGNSHGGQWLPAMQKQADYRHWHVVTYLASQCALATTRQNFAGSGSQNCLNWVHRTTSRIISLHYQLVVMEDRVSVSAIGSTGPTSNHNLYSNGYESVLRSLAAAHIPVVVIRDTPAPGFALPACLRAHPSNYSACNGTRSRWLPDDPTVEAVSVVHSPLVQLADLTSRICEPTVCRAVVGDVPVDFDASHQTATYNRTLAPYLEPFVNRGLAD